MSTLEYLDDQGSVRGFHLVPSTTLHSWLSSFNGRPDAEPVPNGVNRGKVIEELEGRRLKAEDTIAERFVRSLVDRGFDKEWRDYENEEGFTHLEELLIYQPDDWRKQAREYLFRFHCDLSRDSMSEDLRTIIAVFDERKVPIFMKSPILVVLYHPGICRTSRYEPLNFLLAYGVQDPLPGLLKDTPTSDQQVLLRDLSPLDYFLEFQNYVGAYKVDMLRKIGKSAGIPRLCLVRELDFCNIVGQRVAKYLIRKSIVSQISNWAQKENGGFLAGRHPLSMIFAGPSGNGKTELAHWLAKLMNKPNDDLFIKVDCGKLTDATEIFGKAGAYQGAQQGSALNNFVLKMSLEPKAIGIVLLDEIEKSSRDVIHALYQVIDKGEWTNKRLGLKGAVQTDVIPCDNLVFIMTTNACDLHISEFVKLHPEIYNAVDQDLEELASDLSLRIRNTLQFTYPFTEAFLGRVGRIVPFLPMASGIPGVDGIMYGESIAVAKMLIERQQEKFNRGSFTDVKQMISAQTKDQMARIVVKEAIKEAGVRAIQAADEQKMGDRVLNSVLLEKGGIEEGSHVRYFTREEAQDIDFRVQDLTEKEDVNAEDKNFDMVNDDADLYA